VELTRGPGLTNGRRLVRALAVLVFAAGLVQSAARVVGTRFEPVFIVPALLAVFVGWLFSRRSLLLRGIFQVVGFVASGLAVAYLLDGSADDFRRGLLDGPRQVVTTAWPSPRFTTIFVALAALIYVVTAIGIDVAMRVRWRALAIAPMVVGLVCLIAVGAPDGPQWQAVLFAVTAAFVLLWIGLDDRVASIRSGALVAVGAGLAALLATLGMSTSVSARADPRHGESANRDLTLLDPLAEVEAQKNGRLLDLYEVQSPELPSMHRWRVAALDLYNGEAWSTSGQLTPVGNRLDPGTDTPDVEVTVTALRPETTLWVSPGVILRSSTPVETDSARRVVRIIGDARPAVTTLTVEAVDPFTSDSTGDLDSRQPSDIESSYLQLAQGLSGNGVGTLADQVARLATTMHDDYKLSSDVPGGVQLSSVDGFLRGDDKVGSIDQFVSGFVLLARSMGIEARIATGYEIETQQTSTTITTYDAAAWPEVRVNGRWLAVDILPEDSHAPADQTTRVGQPETPAAAQPVDPPQVENANNDEPVEAPPAAEQSDRWAVARVWLLRGGLFTGLLLWPFVVFAIVVTWRKLRRRTGLRSSDPARRVNTAWTLATDALVDAGATLHASHTNAELVAVGVETQPTAGPPLGRLQRHADAVTFTAAPCDPDRAADAVDQLHLVESSIRGSSTRWWRWKWWLSTRSLRKQTQSPLR
jgi:transglutaminase-like putative cysteine protease